MQLTTAKVIKLHCKKWLDNYTA